jgi:hypothetical protein
MNSALLQMEAIRSPVRAVRGPIWPALDVRAEQPHLHHFPEGADEAEAARRLA